MQRFLFFLFFFVALKKKYVNINMIKVFLTLIIKNPGWHPGL